MNGKASLPKVHLVDTSRVDNVGRRLQVEVQVTGKGSVPYIVPGKVVFQCESIIQDRCSACKFAQSRRSILTIDASTRGVLGLYGKTDATVEKRLREWVGVCNRCRVYRTANRNAEVLRVSPRVDAFSRSMEYVARDCLYLGHGLQTNRPYLLECYCFPDPATQQAVLVADAARPLRDSIETFDFKAHRVELEVFEGEPASVFRRVYEDFEANVHRIYGRELLQIAFDLVYHSVLQFRFNGEMVRKGWCECFILGDSGQGKTEMSLCLLNHYAMGDRVQGEGSSAAGLLGGVEHLGDRWMLLWGRIPQMDRKLLVIDEFSGVGPEIIAKLSDVRSTGVAELTKIRTERTSARTRLIMLSNTRDGVPLGSYSTGVEAIRDVFVHMEDVRRLDFALCVPSGEVSEGLLNRPTPVCEHVYTSELCRELLHWAWSRTPDQVVFAVGVEALVLRRATELSGVYSSSIPLVEPADTRLKVARLSVACACRCFSCDDAGRVVVKSEHVEFVVGFLRQCYEAAGMRYGEYSKRARREVEFAEGELEALLSVWHKNHWGAEVLGALERAKGRFRRYMLVETTGLDEEEVKELLRFLSGREMVESTPAGYRKLPKLNTFLRVLRERSGDVEVCSAS